jgi:hypothetical protein
VFVGCACWNVASPLSTSCDSRKPSMTWPNGQWIVCEREKAVGEQGRK